MPTFRIGEWLLEAPIYRVPKLDGDFLAPISPGSQPLIEMKSRRGEILISNCCRSVGERKWKEEGEVFNSLIHREEGSI